MWMIIDERSKIVTGTANSILVAVHARIKREYILKERTITWNYSTEIISHSGFFSTIRFNSEVAVADK